MNNTSSLPPLIDSALIHVHFETIHPFLDGNGRIGRLLIVLSLIQRGLLQAPILYPSYYFRKHQLEYYQRLDAVRTAGDFEGWIVFYLKAIRASACDAHRRAKEIEILNTDLELKIKEESHFSKTATLNASRALNFLFTRPITTTAHMSTEIDTAYNTAQSILKTFVTLGIVSENIMHKRNKIYRFDLYLELLEKEYE